MKNSTKIVIGIVIAVAVVMLAIIIFLFVCFVDMVNDIKENIDNRAKEKQQIAEIYDSIPEDLFDRGILSDDLKYVGYDYAWGYKSADTSRKYYFYIDSDNYDEYKHYWLEDVGGLRYQDGYNSHLASFGNYVFSAVYVSDLSYTYDTEYCGVDLLANKTYYVVCIYDQAIYYKYVRKYGSDDNPRYHNYTGHSVKDESLSQKYIYYQENDEWVVHQLSE